MINIVYLKNTEPKNILNNNLYKFVDFKLVVEAQIIEQPSVHTIVEKLSLTTNSFYRIVNEYASVSL